MARTKLSKPGGMRRHTEKEGRAAQVEADAATQASPSQHRKKRRRQENDNENDATEITSPSVAASTANPATQVTTTSSSDPTATTPSPFLSQTTSLYLPLSPIGQLHPLESLCAEHLSPLLLTYFPPLKGILLSYSNPRLSNTSDCTTSNSSVLAKSIHEYAVNYLWLTANFTLLRPVRGCWLEGHVSVQSESHIGLVCWNHFNASIERKRLPKFWRWMGSGTTNGTGGGSTKFKRQFASGGSGVTASSSMDLDMDMDKDKSDDMKEYYTDEDGAKIEGTIKFRVRDFETTQEVGREKGLLSIEGTLLDDAGEAKLARLEVALAVGAVGDVGDGAGAGDGDGEGDSRPVGKKRHRERERGRSEILADS